MTRSEWPTIPSLVTLASQKFGDLEAVVDGDLSVTFTDLAARVDRSAAAATRSGVLPGDRVAIWAPNTLTWIEAALGAVAAGACLVPLNTRYKGHEAGYILEKSRARLLLTVSGFLDTDYVELLRHAHGKPSGNRPVVGLESLEKIVVLHGTASEGTESWEAHTSGLSDGDLGNARDRAAAIDSEDLSDIMFTSGTTGRPKGVMCSHSQSLAVFDMWSRAVGLASGDRYLIVNPFFHTFGYKAGVLACLMRGATIYPHPVFDVPSVIERIVDARITVLPGPPALYQTILNDPNLDTFDLSSLRLAVTGAAIIPVELIQRMRSDLGFETVLTAYGLTEATGTATMCRPGDDAETIAQTSGRAIPNIEVKVVSRDGTQLPPGSPGEVVVRGYNVTRGYFEDPEATAAAIDGDGWLHTGDIGVMDERGYLRITDRLKDMFIVGGFNAYPAEIENELVRHPAISQAAVVGMPDERLGEVGCAFVVAATDEAIDEQQIIRWSRDRMANFKVPRRVIEVDVLPTNASAKILKRELRERAKELT